MPGKKSFEEQLIELVDEEQPLTSRILKPLSNLAPDNQQQFQKAWNDSTSERKRELTKALVELGEEDVELDFSTVFMYLLHDPDEIVRANAIDGLWEDETLDLLRELIPLLENDISEAVREKAAISLGRFAILAELGKLPSRRVRQIRDILVAQVKKPGNPLLVTRRALEGLGYYTRDGEVKDLIIKAYQSDALPLRASALVAMGRSVDERWLPEIGQELSSVEPELRYEAARAAGELGSQELVMPLFSLIRDRDSEIRLAAIWALGQLGGNAATRILKELTTNDDEATREAAQEALLEVTFAENPLNVLGISD